MKSGHCDLLFRPDEYFSVTDPRSKVLNYGCGNRKRTNEVGVDVSKNSDADFLILPFEPLPFSDDAFDVVVSRYVLEHVQNLDHLLSEVHRVLKPGGIFRFCVPHAFSIDMYDDPTHCRFFTLRTMKYYVADQGSNVCYATQIYSSATAQLRLTLSWPKLRLIRHPINFFLGLIGLLLPTFGENLLKLPFVAGTIFFELKKPSMIIHC